MAQFALTCDAVQQIGGSELHGTFTHLGTPTTEARSRLVEAREAAEKAAFDALASSPRRLTSFRRLLTESQHLVPIREEQAREWTITWPVMRRAVIRLDAVPAGSAR